MKSNVVKTTRISFEKLSSLLQAIFVNNDVSELNAGLLAENCASCERDGSLSHGIFRIPGYISSLRSGWVDGNAVPSVEDVSPALLRVDAKNGFAQPALAAAMPLAVEKALAQGVAIIAIRDSHHFSALWPDLEPVARRGFISLSMVSGLACVAPPHGKSAVFGTNPIAFATPVAGANPMIFDFATSTMSNGDLRIAAREEREVPLGTGINRTAQLTSDPSQILDGGALLPFGGHKGAAISFMVEVLASAFTGGNFSYEVNFSDHPGAETPKTGQLVILIDPARGSDNVFARRVRVLIEAIRQAGQARLPSDRRYRNRAASLRSGISIDTDKYDKIAELAGVGHAAM